MNNSNSTLPEREQPSRQAVWLRATISAAVFGIIGAALGRWLGKRGNDRETQFAESVMTWSMGTFSGLLAAYSVFKAHEHNNDDTPLSDAMRSTSSGLWHDAPATTTQTNALVHEGTLHTRAQQSLIEK